MIAHRPSHPIERAANGTTVAHAVPSDVLGSDPASSGETVEPTV
ncbi:hypothetical protein [Mycolicibacterium helvum]|nr:hypothetical protein [Mycolicibacterium helvum]